MTTLAPWVQSSWHLVYLFSKSDTSFSASLDSWTSALVLPTSFETCSGQGEPTSGERGARGLVARTGRRGTAPVKGTSTRCVTEHSFRADVYWLSFGMDCNDGRVLSPTAKRWPRDLALGAPNGSV